jgi:hypothetical protein
MLYICILSNKFDLNQATRVSHILFEETLAWMNTLTYYEICKL